MTINEETPQEELEHKISEAELKAQEEDSTESEESLPSFEVLPGEDTEESPPEKVGLSRGRRIWRRILIWLVVIAIAFAGGFYLDTTLRYQPLKQDYDDRGAELTAAQGEIDDLEAEVERLGSLEEVNTALLEDIDQLNLHLVLLSLRASVADSALAVEQDRQDDAKLALAKVGSTLDILKDSLTEEQGEVVESMIQRYELIMIELDNSGATVLTDLEPVSYTHLTLPTN